MSSSMRIVLMDPLGDVLFSGESWLASGSESPPAAKHDKRAAEPEPDDEDEDDCPRTLRSGESGIFPVERAKPATNANDAHEPIPRPGTDRDERAA